MAAPDGVGKEQDELGINFCSRQQTPRLCRHASVSRSVKANGWMRSSGGLSGSDILGSSTLMGMGRLIRIWRVCPGRTSWKSRGAASCQAGGWRGHGDGGSWDHWTSGSLGPSSLGLLSSCCGHMSSGSKGGPLWPFHSAAALTGSCSGKARPAVGSGAGVGPGPAALSLPPLSLRCVSTSSH